MKTFREWLEIRDTEFFTEQDMNRRGFLKGLGAMLGAGAATAAAGAAPPSSAAQLRMEREEKEKLRSTFHKLAYYVQSNKISPDELQEMLDGKHDLYNQAMKIAIEGSLDNKITYDGADALVQQVEKIRREENKIKNDQLMQQAKDAGGKFGKYVTNKIFGKKI